MISLTIENETGFPEGFGLRQEGWLCRAGRFWLGVPHLLVAHRRSRGCGKRPSLALWFEGAMCDQKGRSEERASGRRRGATELIPRCRSSEGLDGLLEHLYDRLGLWEASRVWLEFRDVLEGSSEIRF